MEWAVFDRLRPVGGPGISARDIASKTGECGGNAIRVRAAGGEKVESSEGEWLQRDQRQMYPYSVLARRHGSNARMV